jgi:hypothetical protein
MGLGPQQRQRMFCAAQPKECGEAVRESDAPYGTSPHMGRSPSVD